MKNKKYTILASQKGGMQELLRCLLFVVVMLVATSSTFAQVHIEIIDGLRYLIDENVKTATLVANPDRNYSGDIVVPEKVQTKDKMEYLVTAFGEKCFYDCSTLKSISIPSSVTLIGERCFQFSGLTSITIPSSVTSLGESCFMGCYRLTNIVLPASVTSMVKSLFFDCKSLTSVTIPSSVTSLGELCFCGCESLSSITIPSSVTSLGMYCFDDCRNLQSIYFDGKLPKNTIESSIPIYCIFYVPKNYLQDYKDALGSKYQNIYARTDEGGDDKPTTLCDAPNITYNDGKLHFFSSTPGAEYHYTITDSDLANDVYSQDGIVKLSAVYQISAYATADGYQASDKATATLYWINANFENNPSSNINQVNTRGIVVTSQGGIVTLSGLSDGEVISFFAPDGKQVGLTKVVNGIASCAVVDSMVIAKVGGQSLKLMVEQ